MSSRILQPDDPRTVEPVAWRQVGAAGTTAVKPQAASEPAPKAATPEVVSDSLTPANAALRSKLQKFRRSPERDAAS